MTHWLAFDCSTELASFALWSQDQVFAQELQGVSQHAEQALMVIDNLLHQAELRVHDLDGIILGRGPGSFTGLRVAVALAKGLAFAQQIPIYPISNLAVMAWQAQQQYPQLPILSMMDARMQQVYWGYYPDPWAKVEEQVSSIRAVTLPSAQPFVLASFQLEAHLPMFAKTETMVAEFKTSMSARAMIAMVQTGRCLPITAADLEPVYVRDQVTHGG